MRHLERKPLDIEWEQSISTVKIDYINKFAIGKTALDIGTGKGWYAKHLADKGFSVTALDIEQQFDDARIPFHVASADSLPFRDKSFDTVLMFDVIEHIENEQKVLSELARVTKQRLIMSTPNVDDTKLHKYNLVYKHHLDKTHFREYDIVELQDKLRQHGFKILKASYEGPVMPKFIAEFMPANFLKWPVSKFTMLLFKIGLLRSNGMYGDIFVVAGC